MLTNSPAFYAFATYFWVSVLFQIIFVGKQFGKHFERRFSDVVKNKKGNLRKQESLMIDKHKIHAKF